MIPYERSLVSRLAGKPFVLLGVNRDRDVRLAKQVIEREQITWRNGFDGEGGPIARRFRIQGSPTLFLIDHNGIVRQEIPGDPGGATLDTWINELVRQAENDRS